MLKGTSRLFVTSKYHASDASEPRRKFLFSFDGKNYIAFENLVLDVTIDTNSHGSACFKKEWRTYFKLSARQFLFLLNVSSYIFLPSSLLRRYHVDNRLSPTVRHPVCCKNRFSSHRYGRGDRVRIVMGSSGYRDWIGQISDSAYENTELYVFGRISERKRSTNVSSSNCTIRWRTTVLKSWWFSGFYPTRYARISSTYAFSTKKVMN